MSHFVDVLPLQPPFTQPHDIIMLASGSRLALSLEDARKVMELVGSNPIGRNLILADSGDGQHIRISMRPS